MSVYENNCLNKNVGLGVIKERSHDSKKWSIDMCLGLCCQTCIPNFVGTN